MKFQSKMLAVAAGLAVLAPCARATVVQLPQAVVYSGAQPRRFVAKVGDSNIRVIAGPDFRITSQPKANGISKGYLEEQVKKTVTTYDPQTGVLTASTPRLSIGSISAEVTVQVPRPVVLDIRSSDGNVSLERITIEDLALETNDGNVELFEVDNKAQARIRTGDGNVRIQGSSVGRISHDIKGDGKFSDERDGATGAGVLSVTTKDGNVTVRR